MVHARRANQLREGFAPHDHIPIIQRLFEGRQVFLFLIRPFLTVKVSVTDTGDLLLDLDHCAQVCGSDRCLANCYERVIRQRINKTARLCESIFLAVDLQLFGRPISIRIKQAERLHTVIQ